MAKSRKKPSVYYLMLGVTLALVMLGIVMVTSASSILAHNQQHDSFYYLKRQLASVALGLVLMFLFSFIGYRRLKSASPVLMIVSLGLLIFVYISGKTLYGSSRWFSIAGFTFQPSELAKPAVAIYAANVLSRGAGSAKNLRALIKPLGIPIGLAAVLVLIQPDMGTAFTIAITLYILLFLAEARGRDLFSLGAGGVTLAGFFILSSGYRRSRFFAFLDPWGDAKKSGFHIIQSLLALGSGGIHGVGLGLSRQKFGYLPTPFTDFIFAVLGEELGLIGSILVIVLFIIFGFLGMKIAGRAKDRFGRLLAGGITAMIVSQAIINLGAVSGVLPITGIPLPLISFGGSSLVFTLAGVGMLLNVAANGKKTALQGRPKSSLGKSQVGTRPKMPGARMSSAEARARNKVR